MSDATGGCDVGASPGWTLVASDEFDGPNGSDVDPTKWAHDVGDGSQVKSGHCQPGNGWGNDELENARADPVGVRPLAGVLDDGHQSIHVELAGVRSPAASSRRPRRRGRRRPFADPSNPFFIILNLALSSGDNNSWGAPPNAQTAEPAEMKVDYVRVYEKSAADM